MTVQSFGMDRIRLTGERSSFSDRTQSNSEQMIHRPPEPEATSRVNGAERSQSGLQGSGLPQRDHHTVVPSHSRAFDLTGFPCYPLAHIMILPLSFYGSPILRQRCRPVEVVDDRTRQLVADMLETMVAEHGVGLAAPQVGEDCQLAVIDVSHDPECVSYLRVNGKDADLASIMPLVFINPELEYGDDKEAETEGCLSIPGIRAAVKRPIDVKATLPQLDGSVLVIETDGLLARAIQHETDHLHGILFIDRLPPVAKVQMKNRLKRLFGQP